MPPRRSLPARFGLPSQRVNEPVSPRFQTPASERSQRLFLIRSLIHRELIIKYRGSYLGIAWSLLHPLLFLAVLTVVFGKIMPVNWLRAGDGIAFLAMQLYCGLIVFNFFAESVGAAPRFLLGYQNYVKKTVFPTEILPVVLVATTAFHALVNLALLLLAAIALGSVTLYWLLLPMVLLPITLLILGLAWILSALGVYVRDLIQAIPVAVQLLFFVSPVFYPATAVPEILAPLFAANPLSLAIEGLRSVVVLGAAPDWNVWFIHLAAALTVCAFGYRSFIENKNEFADIL